MNPFVFSFCGILLSLKLFLIPSYHSTDFEVHRNWLSITFNKDLKDWYYEKTSEWTLDYPPFFAYFQYALATVAASSGLRDLLVLQSEPLFTTNTLYFQRLSVVVCDVIYMMVCYIVCFRESTLFSNFPVTLRNKIKTSCFCSLVACSLLILVDNVHFQYNALLTSLVLLSIYYSNKGCHILAAFVFCVLLNFKHIYLYYAPAFIVYYLVNFFEFNIQNIRIWRWIKQGLLLAIVMGIPFIASFGPFLAVGGIKYLQQILSRLFPVARGLTHAYWAPNVWALYNCCDFVLFKLLSFLKIGQHTAPTYISGLVQEHAHSVLPTIGPGLSILCVLISLWTLVPIAVCNRKASISLYLCLSALSFFFFGYHVHEKALLLVVIPLSIVAHSSPEYLSVYILFSAITSFSVFPLLFTPMEIYIKYTVASACFFMTIYLIRNASLSPLRSLLPYSSILYMVGLAFVELYNTFIHPMIFANSLTFLPLMFISVYNALGVCYCYVWIVQLAMADYLLEVKKKKLEIYETLIHAEFVPVQSVESLEEVRLVAGVDISTSVHSSQFAVVAISIYSFVDLKLLKTYEEVVLITEPYIPEYLALREATPIANAMRRFLELYPDLRPDVILCDGNGKYHSRGCGVASHIGAQCGIASVGVAKNLSFAPLTAAGAEKIIIDKAEQLISRVSRESCSGFVPFDVLLPVRMNIARLAQSKDPVFISTGYGIELDVATEVVLRCGRSRICEPIRMADLTSRETVRKIFDGE